MRLTTDASALDFLGKLYAGVSEGCLEVRGLDHQRGRRSVAEWANLSAGHDAYARAASHAQRFNADGYDAFLGVNPRCNRGQEDVHVLSCVSLWADIDGLDLGRAEETLERSLSDPLPPDAAVYSGAGLHLYWFLKEPVDPQDEPECQKYLLHLKAMANHYGGDPVVCNLSRVLRFPLSYSHKRQAQTLLWLKED